jgi:hypothetical protein
MNKRKTLSISFQSLFKCKILGLDPETIKKVPIVEKVLEKEKSSTEEKSISILITVAIIVGLLILVTSCITMIYKCQCFLLINIYIIFVFLIYFGLFFGIYFQELLHEINYIVVDKITAFLII